ncbi:MAG: efflux RND transporter periplasmic adaptor subunit [Sneathiella sp.]|nr:efflux RND transporter periplasmic adaptor subunit [Sneathiella sp.]
MRRIIVAFQCVFVLLFVTACEDPPEVVTEHVRSVKTYTVSENAGGNVRNFSGKIVAADSANLSFPAAGTVAQVLVSSGDKVTANQKLAVMDDVPFKLDVDASKAELRKAQSTANEKIGEFNRSKTLFDKGWVSQAALDQAQFSMNAAQEEVSYKTSLLSMAKRGLNDTTLRAPYDGVVGQRLVEPNEVVAAGAPILILDAEGTMEISISVPEKIISKLKMGMTATVTFNVLPGVEIESHVTEISRVAGAGNIFPVKVSLINPPSELRAGMSGDVALTTDNDDQEFGFLIPLSSVAATQDLKGAYVFVIDPTTSTLKKIEIQTDSARTNFIGVKGVHAGDIVVSAGVSFLSEGQKVKLMSNTAQ